MMPANAMEAARAMLAYILPTARCVVDATAGNGHDTLFLCEKTPEACRIWSFDIQPEAVAASSRLLAERCRTDRVRLICSDHAQLAQYVAEPVDAAMFNLGYLPGQNHELTTRPESLRPALDSLIRLLSAGGVITLVAYPGHAPGRREIDFLEDYLAGLPQERFIAACYNFLNQRNAPALLYVIGRRRMNPV